MINAMCLMLVTMSLELQKQHEDMIPNEMIKNLKELFEGQAHQERYENSKDLFRCRMMEGTLVGTHVLKMIRYIKTHEKLGFPLSVELATDVILQSLSHSFNHFP
ncbi:hypothetical protein GQ457_06G011610 [Hibiscus cannabinus]